MAVDMFLKIDGVDGESADAKHKGEIDVESFSWGLSNSGSAAHGEGGGAGKASFQDFSFTTLISKASPQLSLACASGKHIASALLTVRKSGRDQQEFYKITMSDILVSSYKQDGSGGGDATAPTDSVSLNFAKVEVEYRPQNADGALGTAVKTGWDVKANSKI